MDFSPEFLNEVSDYKKLYYWIRTILEQNEFSLEKNYLLIFDIIGVTGKLHCIREIASPDSTEIIGLLHREIIQNLNFILQVSRTLTEALPTTRMDFMGHKGDRIDLVGDAASMILLALLIKFTRVGKDTRILMLEEGSDWEYHQEQVGALKVHNIVLNHEKLDQMPTKDPLSSSQSILFSPSLSYLAKVLRAFSLINEFNMPNQDLSSTAYELPRVDETPLRESTIRDTATIVLKAGPDKEVATRYLLQNHQTYYVEFDSGRKNLSWISMTGEDLDTVLENAFRTYRKFPHAQIFYTRNLAMFTELVNGTTLCIDPYATNILSKLLRKCTFTPGIHVFNPKSPTQGFRRETIENHVGIDEEFDYFGANEG